MTTFIAPGILIGRKGAIKVKDNFPVLAQAHRQSGRGEASTWTGGRFRQALRSSGQKLEWLWKNLSLVDVSKCHGDLSQELWLGMNEGAQMHCGSGYTDPLSVSC